MTQEKIYIYALRTGKMYARMIFTVGKNLVVKLTGQLKRHHALHTINQR
jgi:hypothetical protein